MSGERQNCCHDTVLRPPPQASGHKTTTVVCPTQKSHLPAKIHSRAAKCTLLGTSAPAPQPATDRARFPGRELVGRGEKRQRRHADQGSTSDDFQMHFRLSKLRSAGAVSSCVQYQGRRVLRPQKTSGQMTGTPTNWPVRCLPRLPTRYGLRARRRVWQQPQNAMCARPNGISGGSAIGPATPLPQSFPKFSGATPCATSR